MFLNNFRKPNIKWPQAKKIKGNLAENIAVLVLLAQGYTPISRNFKGDFAEVDVIATKRVNGMKLLILVEVKARKTKDAAHRAIHPDQRARLIKQAKGLMKRYKADEVRLDAVLVFNTWPFVQHIKNAFA